MAPLYTKMVILVLPHLEKWAQRGNVVEVRGPGTGVICERRALSGAVIPAKAGIHSPGRWKCAALGLDSRLRGNDYLHRSALQLAL